MDVNQIKSILKLRSCSRQPMEYHVPLLLNSCNNYLKSVKTFYWDSLYINTADFWLIPPDRNTYVYIHWYITHALFIFYYLTPSYTWLYFQKSIKSVSSCPSIFSFLTLFLFISCPIHNIFYRIGHAWLITWLILLIFFSTNWTTAWSCLDLKQIVDHSINWSLSDNLIVWLIYWLVDFFIYLFFQQVFPDLRQWCEKRRLHLVDCDLRWVGCNYKKLR